MTRGQYIRKKTARDVININVPMTKAQHMRASQHKGELTWLEMLLNAGDPWMVLVKRMIRDAEGGLEKEY